MFKQLLTAILTELKPLRLGKINIGQLPETGGISVEFAAGSDIESYLDRGGYYEIPLLIMCKNKDQAEALGTVDQIAFHLCLLSKFPSGDGWEVVNMSIATPPNYVDTERNEYIYSAIVNIYLNKKGVI